MFDRFLGYQNTDLASLIKKKRKQFLYSLLLMNSNTNLQCSKIGPPDDVSTVSMKATNLSGDTGTSLSASQPVNI